MTFNDAHESAFHFFPCFIPCDFHMHAIALHHGHAQTIRVFVQLLQRAALGANKAVTENVVLVATNTHHLFLRVHGDFQTAGGLTQRAGAENGAVLVASHSVTLPRTTIASYT